MKLFCPLASVVCPLFLGGSLLLAAVDGTVINATTGKPQASVIISLVQPSNEGMKNIGSTRSDANGKFRIDKETPRGPALLQGIHQGATYNLMLQPGAPTTGVELKVFDSTSKPEAGKIAQHMLLVEPSDSGIKVSDTYLFDNQTNTTYSNPANGSVTFFVPAAVGSSVKVTINAPGGMPISRDAEKTAQPDVFKVSYPIKPGESRFDIDYTLPPSKTLSGKVVPAGVEARIVTPGTVTLEGEGIESLGQEPKTQAHVYRVTTPTFTAKVEGTGSLRDPAAGAGGQEEDNGSPQVVAQSARIYNRLFVVLALAFAILLLGGVMLFRKGRAA